MRKKIRPARVWVGIVAAILAVGLLGNPGSAGAIGREALNRGLLSTARIYPLDADGRVLTSCGASMVHPDGYLLTLWRCVGLAAFEDEDFSDQGLKPGDLFHPQGLAVVAPTRDPRQVPVPTYLAQVVGGSAQLNMAVLKITAPYDEGGRLPASLDLVSVKLGDTDALQAGDPLHVVGYSRASGPLVALRSLTASGFDDFDGDGASDSVVSDVGIPDGFYGSAVLNDQGEQVAIPAWSGSPGETLDRHRLIDVARPMLDQAVRSGPIQPTPTPVRPTPTPVSPPQPQAGSFGQVTFGTEIDAQQRVVNPSTTFLAGVKIIYGSFSFEGLRNGTRWGNLWLRNGTVDIENRDGWVWQSDEQQGTTWVSIHNQERGLPAGNYELVLYIGGREVRRGGFTIAAGGGPAPTEGVVIRGTLIDADTKRPLADGSLSVLQPGLSIAEWQELPDTEGTLAEGPTDQNGFYQTSPAIARGKTYTLVAYAKGYYRRDFVDGLKVEADDPNPLELQPIALKKR